VFCTTSAARRKITNARPKLIESTIEPSTPTTCTEHAEVDDAEPQTGAGKAAPDAEDEADGEGDEDDESDGTADGVVLGVSVTAISEHPDQREQRRAEQPEHGPDDDESRYPRPHQTARTTRRCWRT
jgi:hypothetical protein